MNFLAHLYLADDTPHSMIGNLLGDFAKGDIDSQYDDEICRGILLHRKIDVYTDGHEVFLRSKSRISDDYRLLKGIIIDIFYDHFLAKNWSDYSLYPLDEYADYVYTTLNEYNSILPPRLQKVLYYMSAQNWLVSYRELDGIARVMKGMSGRISKANHLAESIEELSKNYRELEGDFKEFFPQLVEYVDLVKVQEL